MITKYSDLPKLPDGSIDFSKVDVHNDFGAFPPLFSNPADIEAFIDKHTVEVPVLKNLLRRRNANQLNLTPTEKEFYFQSMFEYIYDVYHVPVYSTIVETKKWLGYIENKLVEVGLNQFIHEAYESTFEFFKSDVRLSKFTGLAPTIINCTLDIGEPDKCYITGKPECIESFWIKTDRNSIQPILMDEEAYARVHVYPDHVYIFGCDDCSYTLETATREEAEEFALFLKCGAPVWNFTFHKQIHRNLKFSN